MDGSVVVGAVVVVVVVVITEVAVVVITEVVTSANIINSTKNESFHHVTFTIDLCSPVFFALVFSYCQRYRKVTLV